MKRWAQRTRNLIVLGVLLASAVGVASVLTAPWVDESVSDISQQQGNTVKRADIPLDSVPESTANTVRARIEERQRWVDVF